MVGIQLWPGGRQQALRVRQPARVRVGTVLPSGAWLPMLCSQRRPLGLSPLRSLSTGPQASVNHSLRQSMLDTPKRCRPSLPVSEIFAAGGTPERRKDLPRGRRHSKESAAATAGPQDRRLKRTFGTEGCQAMFTSGVLAKLTCPDQFLPLGHRSGYAMHAMPGPPAAVYAGGAAAPRRLPLDPGAGRAGAAAVRGLPGQPRPGAALPGDRRGLRGRHRLGRGQDRRALRHHDHRLDLGDGGLRPLPVRAGLLLGRRVQHARAGAAHGLSRRAADRLGDAAAADAARAGRLCDLRRSTPRSSC